ncbi:MAG: zinc ribbon domain-containing protein [Clostridia bacterium]|nr:zinc ribbon domain-containing protein [Clostridia bacterium]
MDKNIYKEASYGKKQLIITSVVVLILAVLGVVGGIALFINGILAGGVWGKIWRIALGIVLFLLGSAFGYAGFMSLFTAVSMLKNNSGNVKDGNRAKGTINIVKCDKCGYENEENAEYCKNCGESMKAYIECECGTRNQKDAEFCVNCGKSLKK